MRLGRELRRLTQRLQDSRAVRQRLYAVSIPRKRVTVFTRVEVNEGNVTLKARNDVTRLRNANEGLQVVTVRVARLVERRKYAMRDAVGLIGLYRVLTFRVGNVGSIAPSSNDVLRRTIRVRSTVRVIFYVRVLRHVITKHGKYAQRPLRHLAQSTARNRPNTGT